MTLSQRLRRLWLDVHLWIGVGLLVAVVPISVTGAVLVWRTELERVVYADRYAVTGAQVGQPISAYVQAAQAAFGGKAVLTQVRMPAEPGDPVVANGRVDEPIPAGGRPRTLTAWIDPPTGEVMAVDETAVDATQIMHRIHGSLMLPGQGVGRKVVGWIGWAMTVSCLTGLWLWWPRNGAVLKALRWRRGPSTLFNLHHMIGFWICVPLAILSLTGVYISFPQASRALFGVAQPQQRPAGPPGGGAQAGPIANPALSVDAAVAAAQAEGGGAPVVSISTPTGGREPAWRIQFKAGEGPPWTVQVVDASGEVKAPRGGGGEGGGPDPLSRLMRQIHDGNDTGIVWQIFVFLGGVAPAVLSVTGLIMWLRRSARQRAIRHGIDEAKA